MQEIRQLNKDFDSGLKIHELIGKKVKNLDGKEVGAITEIRLDPLTLNFDGIEMDRGFFGAHTFIGRRYITDMSMDGVMLNMNIVGDYKGMKVLDANGKEIGKVKDVQTDGHKNDIISIVVDTGILNQDMIIPKSDVRGVGDSVMLNVTVGAGTIKTGGRINTKGKTAK